MAALVQRLPLRRLVAWAIVLALLLTWVPSIFGDRLFFGSAVSNTATLGIGLAHINFALIAILGALALNILVGYTGLISVAHAAMLAIGAFGAGLHAEQAGLPFWLTVLAVGLIGAAIGVIAGLPSARVDGIYLLLSTLALNAIVIFVCLKYQLAAFGTVGVLYPIPTLFGWEIADDRAWYFVLLACVAAALWLCHNMLRSREGRTFIALRDHDAAAAASGVPVARAKLKAFGFSSFIVAVAGALNAYYVTNASADFFNFHLALGYFVMIVVGGMGSLLGSVLGALLWSCVPAMLATLSEQVDPSTPVVGSILDRHRDDATLVIFGVLVILVLILRPVGLAGMWRSTVASVRRWPYSA
jgi:branched-chain amino acid transport system permease protein